MAVKQNNTESTSGPPSSGGGGSNAGSNQSGGAKTSTTGGGGVGSGNASSGGTKAKKMNPNADGSIGGGGGGGVGGNIEQLPGCSGGTGASAKPKVGGGGSAGAISGSGVGGGSNASSASSIASKPPNDIAQILHLIELVEMKQQQQVIYGQEILKFYHQLIVELAHVQVSRQAEDLKRFKEDIAKVGEFFAKTSEKRLYLFYLHVVCQLITQSDDGGDAPSCAIAVIFQLFSAEMVIEAVQSLLEHKIADQQIRRTVRLLSEWLRICNFCQNLNLWIMAILSGLQEQQKFALYDEIALDNIEQLFASLILPVLRPKVAPIVFHMLSSINHTPQVFHKILPKFARVVTFLKKQSDSVEDYAVDTKKFLQQLVDLTSALMVRFYGYDDLYEPVELALKDFRPSYNYLKDTGGYGTDAALLQHNNANAKVGLVNLGNTCYMNSVLQALAMTKEFSREILLSESKSPLLIKMQQQIALMLYSLRYELTPTRVLNATRPPGFSPGLQQDSSEFLGYLLETLHEQEVTFRKKTSSTPTPASVSVAAAEINEQQQQQQQLLLPETDAAEPIAKTAKQADDAVDAGASSSSSSLFEPQQQQQTLLTNSTSTNTTNNNNNSSSNNSSSNTSCSTAAEEQNANCEGTNMESRSDAALTTPTSLDNSSSSSTSTTTTTTSTTLNTTPTSSAALAVVASAPAAALSTIDKTFTGKLATTYKCLTCGWKSRNVDSFRDLQLSFPEVKNDCASNYSVQDLIDYYCSAEKLYGENQYFCERCKKLSDAERYINVISAPKNLILTLKHFKYDQKYHMRAKLMHKVFHDEKVSVKVCAPETLDEIASVHYDLYAGVVHSGFSMDSGHYYTYAADATNKWYKFNDSIVTSSKSEELHNLTPPNTPYILFYQMGARTNESPELATASTKVIKVDVPTPLALEELPSDLRDYVNHDNCAFSEELRLRRFKSANAAALQSALKAKGNGGGGGGGGRPRRDGYDDDQPPPPSSGCGGNAMNINVNRFVY